MQKMHVPLFLCELEQCEPSYQSRIDVPGTGDRSRETRSGAAHRADVSTEACADIVPEHLRRGAARDARLCAFLRMLHG